MGLESPKASRGKVWGGGLPLPHTPADQVFGERRRGAVKYDQPEFWSGRVPTDPTTSAGHGFGVVMENFMKFSRRENFIEIFTLKFFKNFTV